MSYEDNRFSVQDVNDEYYIIDGENELTIMYGFDNKLDAWHVCNNLNYMNGRIEHAQKHSYHKLYIWKRLYYYIKTKLQR